MYFSDLKWKSRATNRQLCFYIFSRGTTSSRTPTVFILLKTYKYTIHRISVQDEVVNLGNARCLVS